MTILRMAERYWVDAAVVLLLGTVVVENWPSTDVEGSHAGLMAAGLVSAAPLLLRRRAPVAAPAATVAAVALTALVWDHFVPYSFGAFMLVLLATGLLGGTSPRRPGGWPAPRSWSPRSSSWCCSIPTAARRTCSRRCRSSASPGSSATSSG